MSAATEYETQVLPLRQNLYGEAMRLTRDPTEAEDLVQDTMVRAFRFWDTFKQGTNLKAWLFTILRNTYINGYHRAGRRMRLAAAVEHAASAVGPQAAIGNTTSEPPGPEDGADARELTAAVQAAIGELTEDYRRAVVLADIEGFSYQEIAQILAIPIGTVMSRIYRGRRRLYRSLHSTARERGYVTGDPLDERPSTRRT